MKLVLCDLLNHVGVECQRIPAHGLQLREALCGRERRGREGFFSSRGPLLIEGCSPEPPHVFDQVQIHRQRARTQEPLGEDHIAAGVRPAGRPGS